MIKNADIQSFIRTFTGNPTPVEVTSYFYLDGESVWGRIFEVLRKNDNESRHL